MRHPTKIQLTILVIFLLLLAGLAVWSGNYIGFKNKYPPTTITVIGDKIYHFDLTNLKSENRVEFIHEYMDYRNLNILQLKQAAENPAFYIVIVE